MIPIASRKASAVPVAGAPKTFSSAASGIAEGTAAVLDCPPGFATTSSTATSDVNRVTSL